METISKRKQESQYARSLIEASRDPLFTISPEGKITDINNASINITEVTRENLIGTDFFEYFTEPDKAREIYKQLFSEGFVADFPLTTANLLKYCLMARCIKMSSER
jgi:PAS domain-containing protein